MCRPALTRLLLLHLLLIKLHSARGGSGSERGRTGRLGFKAAGQVRATRSPVPAWGRCSEVVGLALRDAAPPPARGNPIVCRGVCVYKQARQELLCGLVSPRDPHVQEDHPKRPGVIDRVPLGAPGESIFKLTWRRTDGSHLRPSSVPKRFSFAICPFILRSSSPAPAPV